MISIHALLAESDPRACRAWSPRRYFYPRSPCGERPYSQHVTWPSGYFYPRSPCGERHTAICLVPPILDFYPRSPCGERRLCRPICVQQHYFYPRSPCGERHTVVKENTTAITISIHALLAESDFSGDHGHINGDISIHALLAESDVLGAVTSPAVIKFLSTLSLRRATNAHPDIRRPCAISIHALLAESDGSNQTIISQTNNFYPRSPCGERHTS